MLNTKIVSGVIAAIISVVLVFYMLPVVFEAGDDLENDTHTPDLVVTLIPVLMLIIALIFIFKAIPNVGN